MTFFYGFLTGAATVAVPVGIFFAYALRSAAYGQ
jgi:hypothetical protein